MPRNSLHLLLTSVAAALVIAGSALLVPALRGDGITWLPSAEGSAAPEVGATDPEAEARREWEAKGEKLTAALTGYAAEESAEFAVALVDNRTGFAFDYFGDEPFETASVAKVDILAALLLLAQDEGRELTVREQRLAVQMIGVSDNDAATSLYAVIGQEAGLSAANARLGLEDTVPSSSWGLTTTTPNDQARLVGALLTTGAVFTDYSRETATGLLTSIDEDQDWGVSAAAAEGEKAALKNGWLSRDTEDGEWIVNSVGRITGDEADLVLVVLSHGNAGYQAGVDRVEKVATMTREQLGA